ncbi:MAG TPA: hypothetical protein VK466_14235 [Terriglobales bacterium]|nr:hypothetical protein [Terriglobales bacterium]
MRKNISAVLCLSLVVGISAGIAYAQQAAPESKVTAEQVADSNIQLMRQDIRSERKKIVAANLPLTETEAMKFWPVYDRYVVDHSKIYDTRYALLKEYAKSYDTMTDEQANSFIKRWTSTEEEMAQLRLKWMPEFEKVISPKKTAMFYQIDRRLGLMVELQLSSQIPLVKP